MNDFKGIIEDVEKSSLVSDKVIEKVIEIIGQEKWQDINDEKSDICTTAGELIITLKGIADLEKENADLKKRLAFARAEFQRQHKENAKLRDNYDQFKASAIPEIERLQKDNAELKKKIGIYQKGMYDEIEKRDKKLTKAIEIIKKLLSCCRNYPQENAEKMEEAEQFLKEIEK